MENMQKQLQEKDEALKKMSQQLEQKETDFNKIADKNETLKEQIKQLYSITQTITIIGASRVGKSCLKDVISGKKFDENHFPTIRMTEIPQTVSKTIHRVKKSVSSIIDPAAHQDIMVNYHIWDCPGQKLLEHIPPLYLTGMSSMNSLTSQVHECTSYEILRFST